MTPTEFKQARHTLGLSAAKLAHILDVNPRTIRKWEYEAKQRPPHPTACRVVQWLLDGYRPPEWPDKKTA